MTHRKAVYTSLVGHYDIVKDPEYVMEGWDYICFSNDLHQKDYSVWQIKRIPHKNNDKHRLSRFAKLNPHLVLGEYEVSLYMDANIQARNHTLENRLNELIKSRTLISIARHPSRNCVYDEAEACIKAGFDRRRVISRQIDYLKAEKFPKTQGLFENNIIFRYHNHPAIAELDASWWEMYRRYSKRDQLSLPYLLWRYNIDCTPLFEPGFNVRVSENFDYVLHKKSLMVRIRNRLQKHGF